MQTYIEIKSTTITKQYEYQQSENAQEEWRNLWWQHTGIHLKHTVKFLA